MHTIILFRYSYSFPFVSKLASFYLELRGLAHDDPEDYSAWSGPSGDADSTAMDQNQECGSDYDDDEVVGTGGEDAVADGTGKRGVKRRAGDAELGQSAGGASGVRAGSKKHRCGWF